MKIIIIAMHGVQAYLLVLIGCVWEQKVYCNALFWNSQAFSINDSILYLWILYIIILILRISWNPGSKPHSACFSKICVLLLQYFLGQISEIFAHNRFAVFKSRKKFMMISFLTTQDLQDFVHINIIFYLADNSCEIGCFSQRTRKN